MGPHGISIFLGSSKCFPCSNHYLLLLPVIQFELAGLLLVIFLTSCNLTVSKKIINGLDIYANNVQFNHAIALKGKHIDCIPV